MAAAFKPVVMVLATLLLPLGCDVIPNVYHCVGGRVAIGLDADGRYQLFLDEEPNTLYLVDPAAGTARPLTDGKSLVTFPYVHQGGVFYVRDRRNIHRVSADGTEDRALYASKAPIIWYPTPSPDGKQLAFFEVDDIEQPARLRLLDLFPLRAQRDPSAAAEPRTLLERALMPMAWRDDKQLLSFVAEKPLPNDKGVFIGALMRIDIASGERRALHQGQFWFHNGLALSGALAVFVELDHETRTSRLRTLLLDGASKASATQTEEGRFDFYLAAAPSGRRWAFTRAEPKADALAGALFLGALDAEKGEIQRELPLGEAGPAVQPRFLDEDTLIIAAPAAKPAPSRLYRLDLKTGKTVRIDEDWRKLALAPRKKE